MSDELENFVLKKFQEETDHFKPVGNYVLLKKVVIKGKEKKRGGIILLTQDKKTGENEIAPDRAAFQVVAAGPNCAFQSLLGPNGKVEDILGQFVIFNDYDAKHLSRDDITDYCLTRDVSIWAIVPNAVEF
jgi:co-chaperonin GroES (HSP10)